MSAVRTIPEALRPHPRDRLDELAVHRTSESPDENRRYDSINVTDNGDDTDFQINFSTCRTVSFNPEPIRVSAVEVRIYAKISAI